jgi:putative SOS response-associated peptidase YedK
MWHVVAHAYSRSHVSVPSRETYRSKQNVSPGSKLPIIHLPDATPGAADAPEAPAAGEAPLRVVFEGVHWGLVPSFTTAGAKPDFFRMFNARSESVASKSVFSRLLKHTRARCLVCVDGFYEWKQEHKVKQPYYLHLKDRPLVFAGLRDMWHNGAGDDEDLQSCTILTTESSSRLKWLHNRMPVFLPDAAACAQWLTADTEAALAVCAPYEGQDLVWHAVTPSMNKASYQGEDCAAPLKVATVSSFFSHTKKPAAAADESSKSVKTEEPGAGAAGGSAIAGNADVKADRAAAEGERTDASAQQTGASGQDGAHASGSEQVSMQAVVDAAKAQGTDIAPPEEAKRTPTKRKQEHSTTPGSAESQGRKKAMQGQGGKRGECSKTLLSFYNKS